MYQHLKWSHLPQNNISVVGVSNQQLDTTNCRVRLKYKCIVYYRLARLIVNNTCLSLHSTIHLVWKKHRPIHLTLWQYIALYLYNCHRLCIIHGESQRRVHAPQRLHCGLSFSWENTRKYNITRLHNKKRHFRQKKVLWIKIV